MDSQILRAREKAPWLQSSSPSSKERQWQVGTEEQRYEWSPSERKVMGAVENDLESCADIKEKMLGLRTTENGTVATTFVGVVSYGGYWLQPCVVVSSSCEAGRVSALAVLSGVSPALAKLDASQRLSC